MSCPFLYIYAISLPGKEDILSATHYAQRGEIRCFQTCNCLTTPLWFKQAIIYEVPVRAFADSNADGIGDFPGLTQKLDYLQDLGVTAIWLLPFFPSPLKDDGYDIADYTNVNTTLPAALRTSKTC